MSHDQPEQLRQVYVLCVGGPRDGDMIAMTPGMLRIGAFEAKLTRSGWTAETMTYVIHRIIDDDGHAHHVAMPYGEKSVVAKLIAGYQEEANR